jgi:hypothetical protein
MVLRPLKPFFSVVAASASRRRFGPLVAELARRLAFVSLLDHGMIPYAASFGRFRAAALPLGFMGVMLVGFAAARSRTVAALVGICRRAS